MAAALGSAPYGTYKNGDQRLPSPPPKRKKKLEWVSKPIRDNSHVHIPAYMGPVAMPAKLRKGVEPT